MIANLPALGALLTDEKDHANGHDEGSRFSSCREQNAKHIIVSTGGWDGTKGGREDEIDTNVDAKEFRADSCLMDGFLIERNRLMDKH